MSEEEIALVIASPDLKEKIETYPMPIQIGIKNVIARVAILPEEEIAIKESDGIPDWLDHEHKQGVAQLVSENKNAKIYVAGVEGPPLFSGDIVFCWVRSGPKLSDPVILVDIMYPVNVKFID